MNPFTRGIRTAGMKRGQCLRETAASRPRKPTRPVPEFGVSEKSKKISPPPLPLPFSGPPLEYGRDVFGSEIVERAVRFKRRDVNSSLPGSGALKIHINIAGNIAEYAMKTTKRAHKKVLFLFSKSLEM